MNKSIKAIFVIAGIVLLAYGVYAMIIPETQVSIGELDLVKAQDNTNAYIAIGLGFFSLLISFLVGRKS